MSGRGRHQPAVLPGRRRVPAAEEAGARMIIVNADPTPFDVIADAVLRADRGYAAADLLKQVGDLQPCRRLAVR